MTFWIISGALTLIAALAIGRTLLRDREEGESPAEARDIQIYRDQLAAVEKDLARGVVTAEEAGRLKTEIKRRILEADRLKAGPVAEAPRGLTVATTAVVGALIVAGAFFLYDWIGAPGYPDMPFRKRIADAAELRASRPSQAAYEAQMPAQAPLDADGEYVALIEKLRTAVKDNPDEIEGWELLARNEAHLGNMPAAHAAQRKVIELKGGAATGEDYTTYAAMLIQAAGGNISAEADTALGEALKKDPGNPIARYYMGLLHLQTGRPDQTFAFWEPLMRQGPPDAPWVPVIRARIEAIAAMAGLNYRLPPLSATPGPLAGPSAEDMAAAADMSPEDRQQMIRGMVEQLSARLAKEGGTPAEWARLIQVNGVLGETDAAAAAWADAQAAFSAPEDLAPIRAAAVAAGVAEPGSAGEAPAATAEPHGPSASDVEAAAQMSPEDRQAMIRSMVDQLGERLATEGGPPQDWARMISSLGVLGETDRAAAIWAEAQERFKDPVSIEVIRTAAVSAGVAE